jgi:RNA polymerase sigma factor (sigma-70 family)
LLREGAGMSDGQLLDCFIGRRDQAVLGALVRRHGPMVWGVCRRVLQGDHDAEDAFQATFLVLVRKAATVMPREMVGNWLYGVAYQTALKARATAARRKARERQVVEMPEAAAAAHDVWNDVQPLLDQELSRLPEKYRSAIVLCDLEGNTRKETARKLGLPEGTLSGHLTRGRALLAKRLARVGLPTSAGALAVVLGQSSALACAPPPTLVSSTIKAGALLASGKAAATSVVSAKVAGLTDWVLKSMLVAKLKSTVAVLLTAGILAAGAGTTGLIHHARTSTQAVAEPEAELASTTPAGAPLDDQVAVRELDKANDELQTLSPIRTDDSLKGSFVLVVDPEPAQDAPKEPKEKVAGIKFEIVGLKIENPPPRKPVWKVGTGTIELNGMEIPITIEFEPKEEPKPEAKPIAIEFELKPKG